MAEVLSTFLCCSVEWYKALEFIDGHRKMGGTFNRQLSPINMFKRSRTRGHRLQGSIRCSLQVLSQGIRHEEMLGGSLVRRQLRCEGWSRGVEVVVQLGQKLTWDITAEGFPLLTGIW